MTKTKCLVIQKTKAKSDFAQVDTAQELPY